jgi:hypothetical protein
MKTLGWASGWANEWTTPRTCPVGDVQCYRVPRAPLDEPRLRPILERLHELNSQARTTELIRICAWAGTNYLGQRFSTAHTAWGVLRECPAGSTHLTIEGCGDFLTGPTWLPTRTSADTSDVS